MGRSAMVRTLRQFGAQGVTVALARALEEGQLQVMRELLAPLPPSTVEYEVCAPELPRAILTVACPGSPARLLPCLP